jgi:glycosyltransferase involved in cell wall biosynthesis
MVDRTASEKKIILVSYIFPPFPGIGGRRWAKFAKYLARKNYELFVICAEIPFDENSLWEKDVSSEQNIHVTSLPARYPAVFMKSDLTLAEKISYRLSKFRLKLKYDGTIFDRAIAWEKQLKNELSALIERERICNVIVTGAPFHLMYFVAKVCEKYREVNLIADFRDPWTDGFAYGIKGLSPRRFAWELEMEKETVQRANAVISPAQSILTYLESVHHQPAEKFTVIPHGFDLDDFPSDRTRRTVNGTIRVCFIGSAYDGLESEFREIFEAIRSFRNSQDPVSRSFRFEFYSKDMERLRSSMKKGDEENVKLNKPVPTTELFREIISCDIALLVFSEPYRDFLGTKFYELLYLGLPLLYVGPEGEISRFIRSHYAGECVKPDQISAEFGPVLKKMVLEKKYGCRDIDEYEMGKVTDRLISLFK